MKNIFGYIVILFLLNSCSMNESNQQKGSTNTEVQDKSRTYLGISFAKNQLLETLNKKNEKQILVDTIINDKETAISVSENILFKIYGKENIINQRPYEVYLIDGYWYLSGTLPKGMLGGTFTIILNSKNGEVIKLTHGK